VRHSGNIASVAIAERDVSAAIHLEVDLRPSVPIRRTIWSATYAL